MDTLCDWCNKEIRKTPREINGSTYHFCNRECKHKFMITFKPPKKKYTNYIYKLSKKQY